MVLFKYSLDPERGSIDFGFSDEMAEIYTGKKNIRISLPLLNHLHFSQNTYPTNTIFLIYKMGINSSDHKESIYVFYIKCMCEHL